ncbi:tyrosine-type recombinase/integrase [Alteribacillus sp. JSM 102045]|uniref:tyrosine-type recombinase/integrase n=1 Tax=Alteribacillus sp. JSM 102045 TaxID=1562101 RepID=UPI0035BF64D8
MKQSPKHCRVKRKLHEIRLHGWSSSSKIRKKLPVYMNLDELRKLFHFLEKGKRPLALRNHLLFKLLATTGMRRQELVDLKWEQVNLENNTIRVEGKGKKERLLPLHPIVIPLFHLSKSIIRLSFTPC